MNPKRENVSKKNQGQFECLSFAWFEKQQNRLLWLSNHWLTKRFFRWVLRINKDLLPNEQIDLLMPHAYRVPLGLQKIKGKWMYAYRWDFRTHMKFSKRLFYAFRPFWAMLHFIDWLALDRFQALNKWSFGFATYTFNPDAHAETTSVDGYVGNAPASSNFATVRGAATGTTANDSSSSAQVPEVTSSGGAFNIYRAFALFDTSSLGDSDVIASATISFMHSSSAKSNSPAGAIVITSSNPASNTALATGDYDAFGTTEFSRVNIATIPGLDQYIDFSLNSSGKSNISKTGVSKFCLMISYDFDNSDPGANSNLSTKGIYFADQTGTSSDPKLVVVTGTEYTKSLTETVTLNDSIIRDTSKVFKETVTLVDSMRKSLSRRITETVTLVSSITTARIYSEHITDAITLVDTVRARISAKVLKEAVSLSDSISKQVQYVRSLVESITLADAISVARLYARSFVESISLTDSLSKVAQFGRHLVETISLRDRLYGILNGVNMKWRQKYQNTADSWSNKYSENEGDWVNKYEDV